MICNGSIKSFGGLRSIIDEPHCTAARSRFYGGCFVRHHALANAHCWEATGEIGACQIASIDKGSRRGYVLALEPEGITVEGIITAVDGPIALTVCLESGSGACDLEGVCPSQPNWRRINDALRQALSDVTLLDISTPSPLPLRRKNIKGDVGQVSNH